MRIASTHDDALTLGDEPFQFYQKFQQDIVVAVCEDRAFAIPNIIHQFPEIEVVLMDDAYQHRRVKPAFNILLTDYNNPFYNDFILPAGRLRESRVGAERADVIIVTKCPGEISEDKMMKIGQSIRGYANCPVFFTQIRYGFPLPFGNKSEIGEHVVLLSGIANARSLEEYVQKNFKLRKHLAHGDHHPYSVSDVNELARLVKADPEICIITTEKDMVKINSPAFKTIVSGLPIFYLPIETEFIKNGKDFEEMVITVFNHAVNN
jgi:tetraacyldisaccharide 4'-kinase